MNTVKTAYRAVTREIEVKVEPALPARALVAGERLFLLGLYHHAHQSRDRDRAAQDPPLAHHRRPRDGCRRCAAPGVVGEEPVLKPGENFEYTSGVPLPTPSGFMTGSYGMVTRGRRAVRHRHSGVLARHARRRERTHATESAGDPELRRCSGSRFDLVRREHVGRAAELAGDGDLAVLDHVVAVVLRKAAQHAPTPRARARALRAQRRGAEHAHAALVEQPVEQPLARQRRDRSVRRPRRCDQRAAFDPGVVLGDRVRPRCPPARRRDRGRAARARSGDLGRNCSSMPPARQRWPAPPSPPRNSSPTASRTRVGICSERRKYSCAASSRPAAVERHQALVAAHVRALVDGHGEMAVAEQRAGIGLARRDRGRDPRRRRSAHRRARLPGVRGSPRPASAPGRRSGSAG